MTKTFELAPELYLILHYSIVPIADEEEVYKASPRMMFECDIVPDRAVLSHRSGQIQLVASEVEKLKDVTDFLQKKQAIPAEKLRI